MSAVAVSTVDDILQYFEYVHLPPHLQEVSRPFFDLAWSIVAPVSPTSKALSLPRCPERTVALRKLLEAKDCAVRCALAKKAVTP